MQRSVSVLALGAFLASLTHTAVSHAQDQGFPSSGRVIVVAPHAAVQIADKDPREVATASVYDYSRKNSPWLWVDSLWGWLKESDVVLLENAEAHYSKVIKVAHAADEPIGVALHQRGIARLANGQPSKALEDFQAAMDEGYIAPNVDINRGRALAALKKSDAAVAAYTAAIAKDPQNGLAYDARSAQLAADGYLDAAIDDANKAVEFAPDVSSVWYDRGLVHQKRGSFDEAIADFNQTLRLSPRYAEAVSNRAYCLKRQGKFRLAIDDYQTAIKIKPNLATAHNDLGWLLATCPKKSVRNPRLAIESAEKAVELASRDNGPFLDTLAAAYASAGKWGQAVKTAEEAASLLEGADKFATERRLELYREKKPFLEATE